MPYVRGKAKKRWTVAMMKVYRRFCGWDTLLRLVMAVDFDLRGPSGERLIRDEVERDMGRALIAAVFLCGARIGEGLGLRAGDVNVLGDRVQVVFNVEKRYRLMKLKVVKFKAVDETKLRWSSEEEAKQSGHPYEPYQGFLTEKVVEIRNIVFPRREPLTPFMLSWVERVKVEKGGDAKLFSFSYNKAYRIIRKAGEKIGEDFPPHRLRAERATQLVLEYGFNDFELTEWFNWKSPVVAQNYTTLAPRIIEKMFLSG